MPVNTPSSSYNKMLPLQKKCRDCIEGESKLHEEGKLYLPGLSGSDSDKDVSRAYVAYLKRTFYYNTVARTKEFFEGLILRVIPNFKYPDDMQNLIDDITGDGVNLFNFCSMIVDETISTGWGAILVDYDDVPEDVITVAEAKEGGYRSKLKYYPAESIINTEGNIRLLEEREVWVDEFTRDSVEQIRVLDLDADGHYRQRVYIQDEKGNWIQYGHPHYPMMSGNLMRYIPFYPCGAKINSLQINKPPLIDLAEASLHHYNVYADYRNGIHFTGFPQLYVAGHKSEESKLRMGSGVAWEFEEPNAVVKYAEFTGTGLAHPERLLDRLENLMGKLGARMLMADKKTAESADKVRHDSASESSLLSLLSINCSDAITKALRVMRDFEGLVGDVSVELNTDFIVSEMNPATIVALMKGVQAGYISHETFLYNVKRGELMAQDKSVEQEMKELEEAKKKLEASEKKIDRMLREINPLSERNPTGFKDPKDEIRDDSREKTDYSL